jgi:hypothetical protein
LKKISNEQSKKCAPSIAILTSCTKQALKSRKTDTTGTTSTKKVDMLNETQEELFFLRHLKTSNASKIA